MGGEVLNESLGVIAGSADVARAVGCPGDGIDAGLVPLEFNNRECEEADVEDDNLGAVHDDGGHISGVLLVPAEADQRSVRFKALVEDPDEAVGGDGSKDADATPGDVIDLLVVGDELAVVYLALIMSFSAVSAVTNITTDEHALLSLKASIITGWYSSATHVCNWTGVICNRQKRVSVLNLSNMGLLGTIPPSMGNLSFLGSLDLSNNSFSGFIPKEMTHLR
ncbi:hypothetical protein RJ640_025984 [Escallonia rubra]|uniref:Leucine-rich repeat-containing N-terminal plant-type domain-containing protein n=1 Tax=Escallonia rubra TaxID=112253 RepID=A0AA88QVX6_9ASTE|nr:hypothetical protein RJ640_025984 [Escallonia rubra]